MDIVRNSDIAQLVLGYLKEQNLEQAAFSFCKTSPYLREEYRLLKKGLRTMSLGSGTLVDIIKEHCQIKSKVLQIIDGLPVEEKRSILKQNTLIGKISSLTKMLMKDKAPREQHDLNRKHLKRTRSNESISDTETTRVQDLPGYDLSLHLSKRRRTSDSYFFVSNSTMINDLVTEEEEENDDDNEVSSTSDASEASKSGECSSEPKTSLNESMSAIPVLSETILKKTEFQNILVENINKALETSMQKNEDQTQDALNAQLDEMIKRILDATEQDPIFDEVIQEISIANSGKKLNKEAQALSAPKENKCTNQNVDREEINENDKISCTANKSTQMTPRRETDFAQVSPIKTVVGSTTKITKSSTLLENNEANETTAVIPLTDSNLQSKFILFNSNETLGALGTDNTFLSCTNLNNIQTFNTNEQVFIDFGSGPIPVIVTNDNGSLPILVNNGEMTTIQQQIDIESSTVKRLNNNEQLILNSDQIVVQSETEAINIGGETSKILTMNQLDSNFLNVEKQTPNDNAIKILTRSFSTPRRRTSHVRVLNFGTPEKNREQTQEQNEEEIQQESTSASNEIDIEGQSPQLSLPSVAENVVQTFSELTEITGAATDEFVAHEIASNSNSLDFDVDRSNQTVIQRQISTETPRRKTDTKTCVRNLTQSKNENLLSRKKIKSKVSKKLTSDKKKSSQVSKTRKRKKNLNENKIKEDGNEKFDSLKAANNAKGLDPLEEWNRMRATFSNPNWDQHLREIQSKSLIPPENAVQFGKRSKRKQEKHITKKMPNEKLKKPQTAKKHNKKSEEEEEDRNKKSASSEVNKMKSVQIIKPSAKLPSSSAPLNFLQSPSPGFAPKKGLIKFKMPTSTKKSRDAQRTEENKGKDFVDDQMKKTNENTETEMPRTESNNNRKEITVNFAIDNDISLPHTQISSQNINVTSSSSLNDQRKEFENMAMLLETPYKNADDTSCQIPITPRFIMPGVEETPITKLMKTILNQTSDHKQILDNIPTPNFALTPGSGLMTSINSDKETPNSACGGGGGGGASSLKNRPTDYSSSSSYYKPDESEDLDRHLDRLLLVERQKKVMKSSMGLIVGVATEVSDTCRVKDKNVNKENATVNDTANSNQQQKQGNAIESSSTALAEEKSISNLAKNNSHKQISSSASCLLPPIAQSKSDLSLSDISSSEDDYERNFSPRKIQNRLECKKDEKFPTKKLISNEKLSRQRAKQLSELEKKRLRIKEKLKEDFSTRTTRTITATTAEAVATIGSTSTRKYMAKRERTVATTVVERKRSGNSQKSTAKPLLSSISAVKRQPAVNKKTNSSIISVSAVIEASFPPRAPPPPLPPSPPTDERSKDQMDVLTALNLSAKKLPNPVMKVTMPAVENTKMTTIVEAFVENDNAVTEDIFEREHISKIRSSLAITTTTTTTTDDSRESAESVKVRNAAMALTTLQKKLASQINYDKIEIMQQKSKCYNNKQEEITESLSSPPGIEIFKIDTNATAAAIKNATPIATRSCKFTEPLRKPSLDTIQKCKHSTRKVKLTPKAKSLSTSSKSGTKKLYQTVTSKAIQRKSPRNTPEKKTYELPTKSKKNARKTTKTNGISPIVIKQPKVILEVMTEKQLRSCPFRKQQRQQQERNPETNDSEKNVDPNKNREIVKEDQVFETRSGLQSNLKSISSVVNEGNEKHLIMKKGGLENNEIHKKRNDEDNIEGDDDDEDDVEDEYDECEMITIDESDKKRFISVICSSDSNKNYPKINFDKSILQTEMEIYLNEIPHVIKIDDEIELFSRNQSRIPHKNSENLEEEQQQQQRKIIKNIPKKREKNAHILHYDDPPPCSSSSLVIAATEENQNQYDDNSSDADRFSGFTSTPCKPKFRLHFKDRNIKKPAKKKIHKKSKHVAKKENLSNKNTRTQFIEKEISVRSYEFAENDGKSGNVLITKSPSPASDDQAKILRQEDIYAVLSHLHGTDDIRT